MSRDLMNVLLVCFNSYLNSIIDFTSLPEVHKQIHIFTAKYLLFLPLVIHVFGSFVTLFDLKLDLCSHKEEGLYFDEEHKFLHLEVDDLFRMFLIFGSIGGFVVTRLHILNDMFFSLAQNIHMFLAISMIADLFRPKPAPHNNVGFIYFPGFFFWVVSKCVYFYQAHISSKRLTTIKRIPLQDNYLILLMRMENFDENAIETIGPFFWINFEDASLFEKSHPFDVWTNRRKHTVDETTNFLENYSMKVNEEWLKTARERLSDVVDETDIQNRWPARNDRDLYSSHSSISIEGGEEIWHVGIVMRVYNPYILRGFNSLGRDPFTFKTAFRPEKDLRFRYSGPHINDYHSLIPLNDSQNVLVCTSAGTAYALDWIEHAISSSAHPEHDVHIYFITRNMELLRFLSHFVADLDIPNVYYHLYYTKFKTGEVFTSSDGNKEIVLARPDFDKILSEVPSRTCVYYCGNFRLRELLGELTEKYGLQERLGTSLTYSEERSKYAIVQQPRGRQLSTLSDSSRLFE